MLWEDSGRQEKRGPHMRGADPTNAAAGQLDLRELSRTTSLFHRVAGVGADSTACDIHTTTLSH